MIEQAELKIEKNTHQPHRFQKGEINNPKGRPRKPEIDILRQALEKVVLEKNMTFIEKFVREAYTDKNVMIALAKKILPDKHSEENPTEKEILIIKETIREVITGNNSRAVSI